MASAPAAVTAPWDRFARWPRPLARLALAALLFALVAAALVPIHAKLKPRRDQAAATTTARAKAGPRGRDVDLALYDRVIARVRRGENYYDFIVAEQRRSRYPVTPGFAVRLPTLAYLSAWLGPTGQFAAAALLLVALLVAWWRRLGEEPGGRRLRPAAMLLLVWLAARGLYSYYFVMHELWAGLLLALAFGLHRPGRWRGALAAAALALAIRELALPFVLLMAAFAFARRDWKEGAAWTALAALFVALLAVHFHLVARAALPSDVPSASWLGLRGLSGWLSNVILPSNLRYYLPRNLAGVLVMLAMLGWAGWRSAAGLFGFWLHLGYGVAFMIAGRWENFYWGAVVAPTLMIGLAFAPRALVSLVRSALPARSRREPALRGP